MREGPGRRDPARLRLGGRIAGPSGGGRPLALDSCGPSCWTAPVDWTPGTNVLALDVTADPYEAGSVSIPVPWPAVPAPGLLRRVQDAMGARTTTDTVETVTSGFGVVLPHRSRRTGQEFLAGGRRRRRHRRRAGGRRQDAAVRPGGARLHVALRLDEKDRIVSERIVTPNHLLTSEYRYP